MTWQIMLCFNHLGKARGPKHNFLCLSKRKCCYFSWRTMTVKKIFSQQRKVQKLNHKLESGICRKRNLSERRFYDEPFLVVDTFPSRKQHEAWWELSLLLVAVFLNCSNTRKETLNLRLEESNKNVLGSKNFLQNTRDLLIIAFFSSCKANTHTLVLVSM